MKNCELCGGPARMHCESDQASLCWDCDRKVHSANFLVAKHKRILLCQVCRKPTPWVASGHILSPAVSVCDTCVGEHGKDPERASESEDEREEDDGDGNEDFDDYDDEEEIDCDDEEDDGENQVVPWSSEPLQASPPVMSSDSSFSGEDEPSYGVGGGEYTCKRTRENFGLYFDEFGGGASGNGESTSMDAFRPLKQSRLGESNDGSGRSETESASRAVISSIKRLEKSVVAGENDASDTILRICRLSRDQRVDLPSTNS